MSKKHLHAVRICKSHWCQFKTKSNFSRNFYLKSLSLWLIDNCKQALKSMEGNQGMIFFKKWRLTKGKTSNAYDSSAVAYSCQQPWKMICLTFLTLTSHPQHHSENDQVIYGTRINITHSQIPMHDVNVFHVTDFGCQ